MGVRMQEQQAAGAVAERSNWGLFDRTSSVVKENGDTYRSLVYHCAQDQSVEFRQPMGGAGTTLMHGDFARKLSPSEEALATYVIKHPRMFEGKCVLDVGAGLGFAGLVCAACTQPSRLELSDGDPEVVNTLRSSVQLNLANFGETQVDVRKVLWDRIEEWSDHDSFDVIIAADVVYLEFLHTALLGMVSRVLKPGGTFLLFASRRNGSLQNFVNQAKGFFPSVEATTDYDADVEKSIGKHSKCFPVMVRMISRETCDSEELPTSVVNLLEKLHKQKAQIEKRAKAEDKKQKKQERVYRARSESLVRERHRRLERKKVEDQERLAAEAEAAAKAAAEAVAKPRVPTLSHAEQDGRSEWGIFARQCNTSSDGSFKDMIYEVGDQSVCIRKHSSTTVQQAKKVSASASDEALAMWISKHRKLFKKKRVLELGAGCGLAGLTAANCTSAKHVVITDSDEGALAMLKSNIDLNKGASSAKKVSTKRLILGESSDALKPFDWIIAADVVDTDTPGLLKTLRHLLKPSGKVLMFAPENRPSLNSFVCAAKLHFARIDVSRDYDAEVTKALHGMSCFPKMVLLQQGVRAVSRSSSKQLFTAPEVEAPETGETCDEASTEVAHGVSNEISTVLKPEEAKPSLKQRRPPEIEPGHVGSPTKSWLPDLAGSRSSSAKSLAVSEASSVSFVTPQNAVDHALASAACSAGSRQPRSNSTSRVAPAVEARSCWPRQPVGACTDKVTSAVEPASVSDSLYTKGSLASVVGSFWARIPIGGCNENSVCPTEGNTPKEKNSGMRASQDVTRSNSQHCLLDLSISGCGLAIQRCSGPRNMPHAPPRLPLTRKAICE